LSIIASAKFVDCITIGHAFYAAIYLGWSFTIKYYFINRMQNTETQAAFLYSAMQSSQRET